MKRPITKTQIKHGLQNPIQGLLELIQQEYELGGQEIALAHEAYVAGDRELNRQHVKAARRHYERVIELRHSVDV